MPYGRGSLESRDPPTVLMRTIAILPIKSFGAAKQRLSSTLGGGAREALAQAMYCDVLTSLRHVSGLDAVAVVTANRLAESAISRTGIHLLHDGEESGHNPAANLGIAHAIEEGFDRVLLVPGDTPLLDPVELDAMLARAQEDGTAVTIVPDRHGTGTNSLLLSPPLAISPSFGPGSLERHRQAARDAGVSHRVEAIFSLMLDVDTPEDLAELADALGERRGHASLTRGALRQLDRSQSRGSAASRRAQVGSPARV